MTETRFDTWPQAGSPRILVLGDLMLDEYLWGTATRISPEAPVLVLNVDSEEVRLGGAASVAGLLRGLDCRVTVAGVVGADSTGRTLQMVLCEAGIQTEGIVIDAERPTTRKERILGRAPQRHPHQIVRVDREQAKPLSANLAARLVSSVLEELDHVQAVVISDYAKGVCTPEVLAAVIPAARERGLPILVDPGREVDLSCYQGATLVKPNRQETAWAVGREIPDASVAMEAGKKLLEQQGWPALLITLDSAGMVLLTADGEEHQIATQPREIGDITGAGDMVIAALACALACGIPLREGVELANLAAGLEVERMGVANVTRAEILAVAQPARSSTNTKVLARSELVRRIGEEKSRGKRIVFTNGCFDLLHVGHLTCLEQAAGHGDVLVVAINSDASVRRLKGANRPVITEQDRARMLAGLGCVSYVTVFGEETPHTLLKLLQPDVLVKGGTTTDIVAREVVEAYGGQVLRVGEVPGRSTTQILSSVDLQHHNLMKAQ